MLSQTLLAVSGLIFTTFFTSTTALAIRTPQTSDDLVKALININGTEYASQVSTLISSGYRPLSLSVYGSPARYASVWAKDITPGDLETIYDADYETYSAWLSKLNSEGYVSTHVSASGATTGEAVFAGIMEKKDVGFWLQQCDQDSPWGIQNSTSGHYTKMASYAMYGTPSARKFCVTLHENMDNTQETVFQSTNGYNIDFEKIYYGQLTKRFWNPTRLYQSAEHVVTPVFQDTQVGKWEAFYNLTTEDLREQITAQKTAGRVPIDISGGGYSTDDVIFTAIFAEQTVPEEKKWNAVGSVTGFEDNEGVQNLLDNRIQSFMQRNGIRQAQVAAAVNGSMILERAYTLAEPAYPIIDNSDVFLLASVSKMFLYAAITQLIDQGLLNRTSKPYEMLKYTQFADQRSENITVQQLLDHEGGFDRNVSPDPMQIFRTVAIDRNLGHPARLVDIIEYMIDKPLDFTPGTNYVYSNYGPMLLSYLLTNITGINYYDYLKANVFNGENVIVYTTEPTDHLNDTVVQQSKFVGPDPRILSSDVTVAGPTGGDGIIKEEIIGTASLATNAGVLARFIGSHAAWGTGRRTEGSRDGSLAGCRSFVQSLYSGIDFAFIINSREYKDENEWQNAIWYDIPDVFNTYNLKAQ